MIKYFLLINLIIISMAMAEHVLRKTERDMLPDEKLMSDMIQKYHPEIKFSSKVFEVLDKNTENKDTISMHVIFTSASLKNCVYNPITRFVSYSNLDNGKAYNVHGYFSLSDNTLFKYERTCGTESCSSSIYKNGVSIYKDKD